MNETVTFDCIICGQLPHHFFIHSIKDRLEVVDSSFSYIQCQKCKLISLHPLPSFEETSRFYPKSFWRTDQNSGSQTLFKKFETWYRERLIAAEFNHIKRFFGSGVTHLDVGCATGDFMFLCQSTGADCYGIELGQEAANYCVKERQLKVVSGDMVAFDFGNKKFDVITYNGVFEHLPNPYEHLLKVKQMLKPSGQLLITGLPNIHSLGYKLAGHDWIGLDCPRHLHQFSKESLYAILTKAGFSVQAINYQSPRFNPPSLIASILPHLATE